MPQEGKWIGAKVRLRRDATLKNGQMLRAGCTFRVIDRHAGGIRIRTYVRGWSEWANGFQPYDFDVLEWGEGSKRDNRGPKMQIEITKEIAEALPKPMLKLIGVDKEDIRWRAKGINLVTMPNKTVVALRDAVAAIKQPAEGAGPKIPGTKKMVSDLNFWIQAAEASKQAGGVANMKCKKTQHFASLAFEVIQKLPKKRLYKSVGDGVWHAYYVGKIEFEAAHTTHGGSYVPDNTDVHLYYYELGGLKHTTENFKNHHVRGLTVFEVLGTEGYVPQTPELDAQYDKSTKRYDQIYNKVGMQFLAHGVGVSGRLDDVLRGEDGEDRWWRRYEPQEELPMLRDGQPSRVVIDIYSEKSSKESSEKNLPNPDFWRGKSYLEADDDEDPDDIDGDDTAADGENGVEADSSEEDDTPDESPASIDGEGEDDDGDKITIKDRRLPIPVRHIVPTFDLARHMRLRIHTDTLTEYIYDKSIGSKLILPNVQRSFITMMLEHEGGFSDIVKGKGGGAIICCAGPAGVGKTLTSEIYAEVLGRPLYSVQCSQLGTDPDDLEKNLLIIFSRAQRWNAILLLDEADVYVAKRGTDLTQNAIVGVFLRVLEYYSGALFMTTNRGDMIDDAVSSRCLARIDYHTPSIPDQIIIWGVLAKVMEIPLDERVATAFANKFPHTSGRDVKNLLKLAKLVSKATKKAINLEMLEYVKVFKPTEDLNEREEPTK